MRYAHRLHVGIYTRLAFLKEFFEKKIFWKKKMIENPKNLPSMQLVN